MEAFLADAARGKKADFQEKDAEIQTLIFQKSF